MRHTSTAFCAVCQRRIRQTTDAYHLIGVSFAPLRMVRINDYAANLGFLGGFPNFNEADPGTGTVFGSILVHANAGEWRDVPASDLGNPDTFEARFSAVHQYAVDNRFVGGFPNFNEADYGQGVVYGCVLLTARGSEWREVPAADLGDPTGIAPTFRAVHQYAVDNGFVGGFPTFSDADHGNGPVLGCVLLNGRAAEWRDIPITSLCPRPAPPHDARFVSQGVPGVLHQGEKRQVMLSMRNIGSATWKAVDAVRLGSQAPQDNTTWGVGMVELPAAEIPPGDIAQFSIPIVAPTAPGRYAFQWRMLQELVEWFGDFSPETTVHIPLGSSSDVTVRRLPDRRLEFWTTSGGNGALFTTWKVDPGPDASWAPWSDFQAEVGGLPGGARNLTVAPLPDGRLELWASTGTGQLFTTWKVDPGPDASWAPWSDFLAEV